MLYGTVKHSGNSWGIHCEPHVRARLKRVFPRAPQRAADWIIISDNPENSRELEWFLQRFPMSVDPPHLLSEKANEHRRTESLISDLLAKRLQPPSIQLAKPPREYQSIVAQAVQIKGGLLLADDVGVGKTVSAICPMADGKNLPALVVVPAHLPNHWVEKLGEFAPHLRVHVIKKTQPYPLIAQGRQQDLWTEMPDVIVCSYHKLRGWAETLRNVVRFVVFEECQQLRNPGSQIYHAAEYLARGVPLRLGLSATPIYNYGSEFFWVLDALLPDALGTRDEFIREWCTADQSDHARIKDTEQFGAYLRREGLMLRRTRRDVGRELPALSKITHTIEADEKVLEEVSSAAINLARIVLGHNEKYQGEKMHAAGEFDQIMRQATGIAKAPYVAEFVRLLIESGESIVLFGWHRAVYEIWMERLKDYQPVLYSGSESPAQKAAAEAAFKSGKSKLLIMSLRSGAGVDGFQHVCRTAVIGELDWSPGVHEQCIGRIHRDGQTDPVLAYYLISDEGSDPVIAGILGIKREQIEGVRNQESPLIERVETGEHHIRALARAFLEKRGEPIT
jgi:SNF2 family DNA or RNA helicase